MSDDYDGTYHNGEPVNNHHHEANDGSEVIFHDHDDQGRNHTHLVTRLGDSGVGNVDYGWAHYPDNVVHIDYLDGRYQVIIDYDPADDNVSLDLADYRGS